MTAYRRELTDRVKDFSRDRDRSFWPGPGPGPGQVILDGTWTGIDIK